MVVVSKGVWCDPCLVPLVKALNEGGIATVASCCGHGHRPSAVILADGRWLVIATDTEARRIDDLFPVDINGSVVLPDPQSASKSPEPADPANSYARAEDDRG